MSCWFNLYCSFIWNNYKMTVLETLKHTKERVLLSNIKAHWELFRTNFTIKTVSPRSYWTTFQFSRTTEENKRGRWKPFVYPSFWIKSRFLPIASDKLLSAGLYFTINGTPFTFLLLLGGRPFVCPNALPICCFKRYSECPFL